MSDIRFSELEYDIEILKCLYNLSLNNEKATMIHFEQFLNYPENKTHIIKVRFVWNTRFNINAPI